MKKLISLIMALVLCLSLCACGADPVEPTLPTEPEEETTPSIGSIINKGVLQYPASNALFKYNIYDTYVEITEYIGDNTAEEVVVPATLENLPVYVVDHDVFNKCDVKSIVFEDGIYTIRSDFSGSLVSVRLPSTLDFVGSGTFKNCYALETVIIPEGIDSIQFQAFMHCHALKEITIPSTVTRLSSETFAFCAALETVALPRGLKWVDDQVFIGCESLKTLILPDTLEEIGYAAFQGTGLTSIEIPASVKKIGSGAFTACESLQEVKVYSADMEIIPQEGFTVALLFSQCPDDLVVHGKPASTIAQACATENIYFEVMK